MDWILAIIIMSVIIGLYYHYSIKHEDIVKYELLPEVTTRTALQMVKELSDMHIKCNLFKVKDFMYLEIYDISLENANVLLNIGALLGSIEAKQIKVLT